MAGARVSSPTRLPAPSLGAPVSTLPPAWLIAAPGRLPGGLTHFSRRGRSERLSDTIVNKSSKLSDQGHMLTSGRRAG